MARLFAAHAAQPFTAAHPAAVPAVLPQVLPFVGPPAGSQLQVALPFPAPAASETTSHSPGSQAGRQEPAAATAGAATSAGAAPGVGSSNAGKPAQVRGVGKESEGLSFGLAIQRVIFLVALPPLPQLPKGFGAVMQGVSKELEAMPKADPMPPTLPKASRASRRWLQRRR